MLGAFRLCRVEIRRAFVLIVASAGPSACIAKTPPCFDIAVGDPIAIVVVDTYVDTATGISSYDSGFPTICGFGFDLSQGAVLQATVVGRAENPPDACYAGVAQIAPFGGWTWTLTGNGSGPPLSALVGSYAATNGTCMGKVDVSLAVATANPFSPSVPGEMPNVIMSRSFSGSGEPGCPTMCTGEFVVNLQKQ
jgi:hypothetical protein